MFHNLLVFDYVNAVTAAYAGVGRASVKGIYTIVETRGTVGKAGSWGKLKSGAGWISLNKCFVKQV